MKGYSPARVLLSLFLILVAMPVTGRTSSFVSDTAITDHLENEFIFDPGVSFYSDIEDELLWSPYVDRDDVTALVEAGVATLTGSTDSPGESSAAVQNALEGSAVTVITKLELE
jgi:hypothetical protein